MKYTAAQVKKFLIAGVGFMAMMFTSVMATNPDAIPASMLPWIQGLIAAIALTGVFKAKNAPLNEATE